MNNMVRVYEYEPTECYKKLDEQQLSNFRYDGDKFKADVNMNSTNVLCAIGGMAIGAALMYYFLKKD